MHEHVAITRRNAIQFAESVETSIATGTTVSQLMARAATDRMSLSAGALEVGSALLNTRARIDRDMAGRSAVSRLYYGMFQAARAIVFIDFGGDDKNDHTDLSKSLPSTLKDREYWANELKAARILRNEADYDPYAKASTWMTEARSLQPIATSFAAECVAWLTSRGIS